MKLSKPNIGIVYADKPTENLQKSLNSRGIKTKSVEVCIEGNERKGIVANVDDKEKEFNDTCNSFGVHEALFVNADRELNHLNTGDGSKTKLGYLNASILTSDELKDINSHWIYCDEAKQYYSW